MASGCVTAVAWAPTAASPVRRLGVAAADERVGLAIAQRLDVPEVVGRLLAARGVAVEDGADFLRPRCGRCCRIRRVLADMDAAAERLARAVQTGETVAVFGDYDVDGACSAALMTLLLRGLGCTVLTHVPDRIREGYGPNAPALRALAARGATLIVCVDCGTAAAEALAAVAGRRTWWCWTTTRRRGRRRRSGHGQPEPAGRRVGPARAVRGRSPSWPRSPPCARCAGPAGSPPGASRICATCWTWWRWRPCAT